MSKLHLFIFAILFFALENILAQAPQAMKYQAIARDNSGNIISNKSVSLRISILKGSTSGTNIYTETHSNLMTNSFGLIDLSIGTGKVEPGLSNFEGIDWSTGIFFVQIEFDPNGGSNYQFMGSSQLLSVPYALYANSAGNITHDYQKVHNLSDVSPIDLSWYQSIEYCKNLIEKGFSDWYLPDNEELLLGFAILDGISFTNDKLWTRSRSYDSDDENRMEIMYNSDVTNSNYPEFLTNQLGANATFKCRCVR